MSQSSVTIVGGGLAGSLMAIYLAQRGTMVDVYEYRSDIRVGDGGGGRSINLALSDRGLRALAGVGLEEEIRRLCLPMHGRMIHSVDGSLDFQPYGKAGQHINSISRHELNCLLMRTAEEREGVRFHFRQRCEDIDLATGTPQIMDLDSGRSYEVPASAVIAADGAFSAVRQRMQKTGRFNFEQDWLGHGYKELTIPAGAGGRLQMEGGALHIWPRHDYMLIALPNLDGTFTCTLFLPYEGGQASFEALQTPADVERMFREQFPDAQALMPRLTEEFFDNPTGQLVTMRCSPYNFRDRALLIGDAAHAVVPFYGQGMNAAFEDCRLIDDLMGLHGEDWGQVFEGFSEQRVEDANAIADLALYNYLEMRSLTASPLFLVKKRVDRTLNMLFPAWWKPLYEMVTFSHLPYAEAKRRAARQDELLRRAPWVLALVALLLWLLLG